MTAAMFQVPKDRRTVLFYLMVPLGVLLVKSILLVQWGAIYGRLSMPPSYDDATYFADALERVLILLDQGILPAALDLIRRLPHAPYSTLAAMTAFVVGGPNLAGPYVVNAITVALLTALLLRLFRVRAVTTWCIVAVVVTTPWFDWTVTIFHPDLISGYATAITAAVLIWQDEIIATRTDALMIGAVAGVILLIKPVAFAMVIGLWGLAFIIGAIIAYRHERSSAKIAVRLAFGLIPIALIGIPYFARELGNIFAYIHRGFVIERETWLQYIYPAEHSFYYVDQAKLLFKFWFYAAGAGSLAIVVVGASRGGRASAIRFAGFLVVTTAAYLVPSALEVKHTFYGGVFYGCVLVCLILAIHHLADRLDLPRSVQPRHGGLLSDDAPPVRNALAAIIFLVAICGLSDGQMRSEPDTRREARTEYDGVYKILTEVAQSRTAARMPPGLLVFFPCPAPVAPHAYRIRGLLNGLDLVPWSNPHEHDLQAMIGVANRAVAVVVPDDQVLKLVFPYPVNKLLPAFRDWLGTNPRFKRVDTVHTNWGGIDVYAEVPAQRAAE